MAMIGIMLPIISSVNSTKDDILKSLGQFSSNSCHKEHTVIFVGINDDDDLLLNLVFKDDITAHVLRSSENVSMIKGNQNDLFKGAEYNIIKIPSSLKGQISKIANILVRHAYETYKNLDYFVLLGDDIRMYKPADVWIPDVDKAFKDMIKDAPNAPPIGTVILPDDSFPGFPTFPIVPRSHVEIFNGFWTDDFINQDGDPFIYELYRKFGLTRIVYEEALLKNEIGGESAPRYIRNHIDWKGKVLNDAFQTLKKWIGMKNLDKFIKPIVRYDVVVPSYRGDLDTLRKICNLEVPSNADVMIIIMVDDPKKTYVRTILEREYPFGKVRIRTNPENIGASNTRNAGINESAAEWILFLDDDVIPSENILIEYAKAIQEHGANACGFAGPVYFAPTTTLLSEGLRMSFLTYFWDMPNKIERVPWHVTANLCLRKTQARFDARFPKTGGGEDIDMCIKTRNITNLDIFSVPEAYAQHPYWDKGNPNPMHFYGWAVGDSFLMSMYRDYIFLSYPNIYESLILFMIVKKLGIVRNIGLVSGLSAITGAEALMDCYFTLKDNNVSIFDGRNILCSMISFMYRCVNELGHLVHHSKEGLFLCRFDFMCGMDPRYISEKRRQQFHRFFGYLLSLAILSYHTSKQV